MRWSDEQGRLFAAARGWHRHSQAECLEALRILGAGDRGLSPASISGWEAGVRGPPETARDAVEAYVGELSHAIAVSERQVADGRPQAFSDVVAPLTGAPVLLDDRQAAFVDGLIERLRSGSELSSDDGSAVDFLRSLLGLDQQRDDRAPEPSDRGRHAGG